MKNITVYYEETYGDYYQVLAETPAEAESKLPELIARGEESSPEPCQGSVAVALVGNGIPDWQVMGGKIDAMPDDEKEFYLWHLLRFFYKRKLQSEKEKYDDRATQEQLSRLLANVEEIDTLLCYDLF